MAAPSLEHLFDTQAVFESAISAYLTANGVTAYTSRSDDDMTDSRIECQFVPQAAVGHQATRSTTNTGWVEQDWFTGIVNFQIQTERARAAASPVAGFSSIHDYNVARIKVLMLRGAINGTIAGITPIEIPYHRITVEGFAGQTPSVEMDGFDLTQLSWNVTYQIKADAWPA